MVPLWTGMKRGVMQVIRFAMSGPERSVGLSLLSICKTHGLKRMDDE